MKALNGKNGQRKAISPIIATVLIIAVTLIASVAIGGFVFGIFAQGQNSAQVAVTGTALLAVLFQSGNAGPRDCIPRVRPLRARAWRAGCGTHPARRRH